MHARREREIVIGTGGIRIPRAELRIRFVRSGGPGGQNVNKVATKAVLEFRLEECSCLSPEERSRIRRRLAGRISSRGVLRLHAQRHRTRGRNEAEVIERFRRLLTAALAVARPRIPTRPTRASLERRLADKRSRSRLKEQRREPGRRGEGDG